MAEIHLKPSNNPNIVFDNPSAARDVAVGHTAIPKYVGARAVVTRSENGVTIWMKDYKGETTETIAEAIQSITTNLDGSLTFTLPDGRTITTGSLKGDKGDTGDTGATGNGIASVSKTGTSGLVDTYTITYTNGGSDTFTVTNGEEGNGIASIVFNDDYTMTIIDTDGNSYTSGSLRGAQGETGATGATGPTGPQGPMGTLPYATCDTLATTSAKVATIVSGTLDTLNTGSAVIVYFSSYNMASSPTLKVGNTDAKQIMRYEAVAPGSTLATSWNAGSPVLFIYDGTYWRMVGFLNTTYDPMPLAEAQAGTASTYRLIAASVLKEGVKSHAPVKDVTVDGTSVLDGDTAKIDLTGKANVSDLATVATSGDYDDLLDKPTIPALGKTIPYGECSTATSTVAKTVTIAGVTELTQGLTIAVKFSEANSATNPTLQVNSLTAKSIKKYGTTAPGTSSAMSWYGGSVLIMVYDGTYWQICNWDNKDTTYSSLTQSDMQAGTATTGRLITAYRLKEAILYHETGEPNVQSDWNESDTSSDAYIQNKPTIPTVPTNVSAFTNDAGYITGMTILAYGTSTWQDFITAYNANKVVYCRASSNSNPATGSQTRLAFMAYVNNAETPTEVEFQYYRSIATHSASQQGDQVFVYKLTNSSGGTWTVITREASTKMVAGSGLSSSYSNGTLTLSADVQSETDPIFTASAAHGISSSDITAWNGKQEALVSGTNIKTVNGVSILGSGDIPVASSGTSIPTADTVAEFDSDAHINSDDMSAQDVSDFVDALAPQGYSMLIKHASRSCVWSNSEGSDEFYANTLLPSYTHLYGILATAVGGGVVAVTRSSADKLRVILYGGAFTGTLTVDFIFFYD